MKKYLIFRTDRVGDFLFTLKFIKIIKLNDRNSEITVVASERNQDYIKTFTEVDKVILLKNNLLSKIKLIFNLRKDKYDTIIVHDGKNRSRFVSFFLKSKFKVVCVTDLIHSQIDIIKGACKKIFLEFHENCIDFLDKRNHSYNDLPFKNYIHLHFDEKWIFNDYIKKYKNIEPKDEELLLFINNIVLKNKKLIVTTGKNTSIKLNNLKEKINHKNIKIYENQSLLEIENIVFKSELLITCHGWISHIASARKIKQIDIIDESYPYNMWTSHFRNYNYLNRTSFNDISKQILDLI